MTATKDMRITTSRLARGRLGTIAVAVAAAEGVYLLTRYGAGTELALADGTTVGAGAVAVCAALAGFAGWALLAVLERFTSRARRIWIVTAAAVFVVSLLGPLGGAGTAAVLGLISLHSTVAAALIAGLPCYCRR